MTKRAEPVEDDWTEFDSDLLMLIEEKEQSTSTTTNNNNNNSNSVRFISKEREMLDKELAAKQPTNGFAGFSTAKGKPLPPPSEESKLKAAQLFEGLDDGIDKASTSAPPPMMMMGFSTGNGRKLQPVSEEARKRAQALFDDIEMPELPLTEEKSAIESLENLSKEKRMPAYSSFATASGNSLKPPSKEAIENANKLFNDDKGDDKDAKIGKKRTVNGDLKYDQALHQFGGFTTGNSKKSFDISSQVKRKAAAMLNDVKEEEKTTSPSPSPTLKQSANGFLFPKRSKNRAPEVRKQNRQFKSPIIKSNFELTKAAVNNRNFTKSKAKPVFDLKGK